MGLDNTMVSYITPANKSRKDLRLIEAGFPCHQVGAETQRERGASSALPPLYYLHVWWARRPLTPSRAAILASILPADTDPESFLRQLGIEKVQAIINGEQWTLNQKYFKSLTRDESNLELLHVDSSILAALGKEQGARAEYRKLIDNIVVKFNVLKGNSVIQKWELISKSIPEPFPLEGDNLQIRRVAGDPAWFKELMKIGETVKVRVPNLYGYDRAYNKHPNSNLKEISVLDPTAGGGSIPFEALRLGCNVIANELNPVACCVLYATLDFPVRYGVSLINAISNWGQCLLDKLDQTLSLYFPRKYVIPANEQTALEKHLKNAPELISQYNTEDSTTYLFARQVRCPHCGGEALLLNTCWLAKEEKDQWGVNIVTDGRSRGGTVSFETYRVRNGAGPNGEDPNFATVNKGVGTCVHCRQAILGDEIKAQARAESAHGKWKDRLYCVVAVRLQPKLDRDGKPLRYQSGEKKGEIKTEKIRFFRPPSEKDLDALERAERRLQERRPEWEAQGLIPTEQFPPGNDIRPVIYGMPRWCDMFTPRQLLGHLTMVEELNRLKPQIIQELGEEKGRAVITYLQFAIDKGLDYNSKQTRWIPNRGIVSGTFGRHDFSLKWTFGEMIFTGPNSGAAWALSQILDAYKGMAELMQPAHEALEGGKPPLTILHGTAAHMAIPDKSIDLVCMDPPYYNNVQYAELSDYFYVWQKRTLKDLYPELFARRLTNKADEAVANPVRDGSSKAAKQEYERLMGEIFAECRRVLKDDGMMTLMFTHKTQEAWESLTHSLIVTGWVITSAFPVESEFANSQHIMENASAASSIFLSCRKRKKKTEVHASWTGFGNTGVQNLVREAISEALAEFEPLQLNPVDEMVACYGRALRVLSEQWPVLDGDNPVSPVRAMNEASGVVAQHQVIRLTGGRLKVDDLHPEAGMALILYGIHGLQWFNFDEALNLSRSLNIRLETKTGGYLVNAHMVGINQETRGRRNPRAGAEDTGYYAPLAAKGSKLRLVLPEERNTKRLEHPQTEWDILHGLILAHRKGDIPVAMAYLERHAKDRMQVIEDLLAVWSAEIADEKLRLEGVTIAFGLR